MRKENPIMLYSGVADQFLWGVFVSDTREISKFERRRIDRCVACIKAHMKEVYNFSELREDCPLLTRATERVEEEVLYKLKKALYKKLGKI